MIAFFHLCIHINVSNLVICHPCNYYRYLVIAWVVYQAPSNYVGGTCISPNSPQNTHIINLLWTFLVLWTTSFKVKVTGMQLCTLILGTPPWWAARTAKQNTFCWWFPFLQVLEQDFFIISGSSMALELMPKFTSSHCLQKWVLEADNHWVRWDLIVNHKLSEAHN